MAMEIALITFGVGGIGEYVTPLDASIDNRNAQLVNEPTPQVSYIGVLQNEATHIVQALAEAVLLLIRNESLRLNIGKNGRRTVVRRFTLAQQIERYAQLYRSAKL
jgi:glycosyltransferase involved in cell wall biosynthesis